MMPDTPSHSSTVPKCEPTFRVRMVYRPTLHVTDLDEAEDFFARVFGRPSTNLSRIMTRPPRPGHTIDHSSFTSISDVLVDSLDPKRYLTDGEQRYPSVEQSHLKAVGWYVDGVVELYNELTRRGIRVTNARDEILLGEDALAAGLLPMFHALPADAGIRYDFFPIYPFPADPRLQEGWSVPPASDDDPLGIEYCSHHTIVTSQPERARRLVVDVLGGQVIHEGRDELRGVSGRYVHLAHAVFHYAVADPDSPAQSDSASNEPNDTYHALTWKVADLDRAVRHLESQGVRIQTRSETTIVTDARTSLGVPWGFTTESVPGDPRARSAGD